MSQYIYTINGNYYLINKNINICTSTLNSTKLNSTTLNSTKLNSTKMNRTKPTMCGNNNMINNGKIIEKLIDVGSKTVTDNSQKYNIIKDYEKNIDTSSVIKEIQNILSDTITEISTTNMASIARLFNISNEINISEINSDNITISNITQIIEIDSETTGQIAQESTTKIITNIKNIVKDKIDNIISNKYNALDVSTNTTKTGTEIGSVLKAGFDVAGGIVETMFAIGVNNSISEDNSINHNEELKDKYNLDQSFEIEQTKTTNDSIINILSKENIADCIKNTESTNKLKLGNFNLTGDLVIENIEQKTLIKDIMNCAFNQKVLNDIATNILNDFDKNISNAIDASYTYAQENDTIDISGDIYAGGTFLKDAFTGAGDGIAGASEGIGKGINNIFGGGTIGPIIALIVVLLLIGGFVYLRMKFVNKSNTARNAASNAGVISAPYKVNSDNVINPINNVV